MDALTFAAAAMMLAMLLAAAAADPPATSPALPDFDKLWNYGDPAGTERTFREVLASAPQAARDYRLELLTQIARCQGLQARFEDAHKTLDEVERGVELPPRVKSRLLLERGRCFNSAGEPGRALPIFRNAFDIAKAAGEWRFAIDAAHMIAIAAPDVADNITWNLTCLELIEQHPDQDRWRPAIWNNLGEAYRADAQYERALECFRNIIAWLQKHGKPVDRYASVDEAKMLRLLGRPAESLERMEALQREIGGDAEIDGFVAEERAEALLALGREDDARPLFKQAWGKLRDQTWLLDSEPRRCERLRQMAGE